jgi:hypothetical protein
MYEDYEEKIQREIIRRALERSRGKEQERKIQDVVEVLCDMTDLSRNELNRIAARVMETNPGDNDRFFSINQQLFVTGATLLVFGMILAWLF